MPDDITSLYPQAPQPPAQNALLGDPTRLIGMASDVQKLQLLQQQTPALAQIPGQQLQNLQLANTANIMQQQATARQLVASELGNGLLGVDSPTADDVHNLTAYIARSHPEVATRFPDILTAASDSILDNPKGIKSGANTLLTTALSPENAAGQVYGQPTPGGQLQQQTLAQAVMQGPHPIGTPPGFAERQVGGANTDVQLAGNLSEAAEGAPQRIALLGNLENNLSKFTSGPGADWTKVAKAFVNRNVPLPAGWQFDPSSIASQEEFVKQATQLAQQQFGAIGGTGTDAKFASAFQTNPNDTLSQLGNGSIIRLLKGNEGALRAKNNAWLSAQSQNPALSYRDFSNQFNANFDPRVFQFQYFTPAQRQAYYGNMNPNDQQRFLHALAVAQKNGWVSFRSP